MSDQAGLDDFGVWVPAFGDDWTAVLLWSPYVAESERPQIFLPGDWIPYLRALAACRSRAFLDWRAAHWIPGASQGIVASRKWRAQQRSNCAALPAM